jgi:pimeloyl-ACP methyl ester carboxylesterase
MRELKSTFDQPGCLSAALDYYRFTFGSMPGDPALEPVGAKFTQPTPVPTLYLHGNDDGVMGIETVVEDELRPFFPAGLELVVVPGTGHFLHLEEPEVVNHRIVTFLTA